MDSNDTELIWLHGFSLYSKSNELEDVENTSDKVYKGKDKNSVVLSVNSIHSWFYYIH